jgi:hypothetical protein
VHGVPPQRQLEDEEADELQLSPRNDQVYPKLQESLQDRNLQKLVGIRFM